MAESDAGSQVDTALVARALAGNDRRAFEQLVRRHQGMVRAQLRRLLHGDHAAADDLAQETFLLAWRKLQTFRSEARFSTWLYRIAYTCFLQSNRKKSSTLRQADEQEMETMRAPSQGVDLQLDLMRAMAHLSQAEQSVLLHCLQLELSHEEAAYVLGMPLGTVKTHVARGKAKLRARLSPWNETSHEEHMQ